MNLFCPEWPFGDLPQNGFDFIMADPPWNFENFSKAGEGKNAKAHYDCMSLKEISALPVADLASENCLLMLWATNPMLPEAMNVMVEWGFTFKTAGTWVKRTSKLKEHFGTGYLLRSSNEPFLIGARGKPATSRSVRGAISSGEGFDEFAFIGITIEAVAREHSRKPDEAYEAAVKLMPDANRLELFSREARTGWSAWGNEVGKFK